MMNKNLVLLGRNSLLMATVALTTWCFTGCSTMTSFSATSTAEIPLESSPNGTYSVEMHPAFGTPKQYKGALDGSTTVSKALKDSDATRKFRGMEVEILRIVDSKGQSRGLRMPVNYSASSKSVADENDYALLDGDRVVVRPVQTGSLLKMVSGLAGGPK